MKETVMEFRGINISHLGMYFEELGAVPKTEQMPLLYDAGSWSGEILSEKELTFTKTFKVNAVHIRFKAETEVELADIIKNYRYKTTRIGG
ncbi:hypothetical protein AM500_03650 [Bacillus sp. FJAT-18017]|uniref:hypothetical protein n=1 Tax=Bacillus sp. FJAT-18017 TaxID=1705566 RepID=UPI0006B06D48|nr:hypothetical protein [Bacillus sp. FJAT-18017]ALC88991.1 hypothetical protein AM500_03650 [Bacillus sp. FJAT-18017]